jgi:hypothetical protein
MKKIKIIKVNYLPFRINGFTFFNIIIVKNSPFINFIIEHEKVHISRNSLLWYIKYILFPSFRMEEEWLAYNQEAKYAFILEKNFDEYYSYFSNLIFKNLMNRYFLTKKCKNKLKEKLINLRKKINIFGNLDIEKTNEWWYNF